MVLEYGTLEVLDSVALAIEVRYFVHRIRDGEALLGECSIVLPVVEEDTCYGLTCFGEGLAACAGDSDCGSDDGAGGDTEVRGGTSGRRSGGCGGLGRAYDALKGASLVAA